MPVLSSDALGTILFAGFDGDGFRGGPVIKGSASEDWSSTGHGSNLGFRTVENGTTTFTDRMIITNDGKVGVGTMTPFRRLNVAGNDDNGVYIRTTNSSAIGSSSFELRNDASLSYRLNLGGSASPYPNSLYFYDTNLGSNTFLINPSGKVGIGTSDPLTKLHIQGAAGATNVTAENLNTTGYAGLRLQNDLGRSYSWRLGGSTSTYPNAFYLYDSDISGPRLMVDGSGNVGIGTTTPTFKLDVRSISPTYVLNLDHNNSVGTGLVSFMKEGVIQGSITVSGTTVSYNAFTGSHFASYDGELMAGELVTLTGSHSEFNGVEEGEPVYQIVKSSIPNDPKILGTYLHDLDDMEDVKGISAVGNGEVWVVDNGVNLKPGDYLISSDVEGHAMKDNGDFEIAYVFGRVAETINWENETNMINGLKHKKISIFYESFIINHKADKIEKLLLQLMKEVEDLKEDIKTIKNNSL